MLSNSGEGIVGLQGGRVPECLLLGRQAAWVASWVAPRASVSMAWPFSRGLFVREGMNDGVNECGRSVIGWLELGGVDRRRGTGSEFLSDKLGWKMNNTSSHARTREKETALEDMVHSHIHKGSDKEEDKEAWGGRREQESFQAAIIIKNKAVIKKFLITSANYKILICSDLHLATMKEIDPELALCLPKRNARPGRVDWKIGRPSIQHLLTLRTGPAAKRVVNCSKLFTNAIIMSVALSHTT